MAKPRSRDSGRFRIYVSDRSGFEFGFQPITSKPNAYTRESGKPVQDLNVKVAPNEFDTPPPSKKSLGGEGDISNGNVRANADFAIPSNAFIVDSTNVVVVAATDSIAWNQYPWTSIAGSAASQTLSSNPQVARGQQDQQITLMCVSNQITIITGNGLTLRTPTFQMNSGDIIGLMYQSSNTTWFETSRSTLYSDRGAY